MCANGDYKNVPHCVCRWVGFVIKLPSGSGICSIMPGGLVFVVQTNSYSRFHCLGLPFKGSEPLCAIPTKTTFGTTLWYLRLLGLHLFVQNKCVLHVATQNATHKPCRLARVSMHMPMKNSMNKCMLSPMPTFPCGTGASYCVACMSTHTHVSGTMHSGRVRNL